MVAASVSLNLPPSRRGLPVIWWICEQAGGPCIVNPLHFCRLRYSQHSSVTWSRDFGLTFSAGLRIRIQSLNPTDSDPTIYNYEIQIQIHLKLPGPDPAGHKSLDLFSVKKGQEKKCKPSFIKKNSLIFKLCGGSTSLNDLPGQHGDARQTADIPPGLAGHKYML